MTVIETSGMFSPVIVEPSVDRNKSHSQEYGLSGTGGGFGIKL